VSDSSKRDLPPPLPGPEAAARRAQDPIPVDGLDEPSQVRKVAKAVFIGIVGFLISAAIPIILVIILAIVAQLMIGGH
jgi:hypothetical protein